MKKSEINAIIAATKKLYPELIDTFPHIVVYIGGFQPAGANWAYRAGVTDTGRAVVTLFGAVVGEKQ